MKSQDKLELKYVVKITMVREAGVVFRRAMSVRLSVREKNEEKLLNRK